jgi:hypothetical protein
MFLVLYGIAGMAAMTTTSRNTPRWVWAGLLLWAALLVAGFAAVELETNAPGAVGDAPPRWPAGSAIQRADDKATLLMFLHPHCPCSDASVSELERIAARVGTPCDVVVVFVVPRGSPDGWEQTRLWRRASALPATTVFTDLNGVEARRFGALTSGVSMVYNAGDALTFHGGVTPARGHEGDNAGKASAECCLRGNDAHDPSSCVYGCPLEGADSP